MTFIRSEWWRNFGELALKVRPIFILHEFISMSDKKEQA
jgi:hypothetical protein